MEQFSIADLQICHVRSMDTSELFANGNIVERNMIAGTAECQHQPPWHLPRIGDRKLGPVHDIMWNTYSQAEGVQIYIVDTWVDIDHPIFEKRIQRGPAFASGEHMHGTHVAGLALGAEYGIARKAHGLSIQVLDGNGQGAYSTILQGLQWVSSDYKKLYPKQAVINMSIGGPRSEIVNQAVEALRRLGNLHVVVAAGNSHLDACSGTPSGANVLVVGASSPTDTFADFSNYGPCVKVVAPGEGILSAIPHGQTAFLSGTSMASPIVAGITATLAARYPNTGPEEMEKMVLRFATPNVLHAIPNKTPNLLVYYPWLTFCNQLFFQESCFSTTNQELGQIPFALPPTVTKGPEEL